MTGTARSAGAPPTQPHLSVAAALKGCTACCRVDSSRLAGASAAQASAADMSWASKACAGLGMLQAVEEAVDLASAHGMRLRLPLEPSCG